MSDMISIRDIAKGIASLAYPAQCAACKAPVDDGGEIPVCRDCLDKIRPSERPPESDARRFSFSCAYSVCRYEGSMKELTHSFKYRRKASLAKLFSNILTDFINDRPEILQGIDIVTFVPLQAARSREREFNQSELLARGIAGHFSIAVECLLEKAAATKNQNKLPREERMVNLRGAFRPKAGAGPAGRRVLLVDDVMTTGATLDECSKTLIDAGAIEVRCLTLSRGA